MHIWQTYSLLSAQALLLLRRSIGDPEFKRIFCLVHAERLSFQVADNVLKGLDEMIQGHLGTRIFFHLLL